MDSKGDQIKQLIEEGNKFSPTNFCYPNEHGRQYEGYDKPEWLAWKTRALNLAKSVGSDDSPAAKLAETAVAITTEGNYLAEFERALSLLKMALDLLLAAATDDAFGELRHEPARSISPTLSSRVFVVHGHDNSLKTDVERFLLQLGLDPVVLHRRPDQGQTIIEKFEQHGDVGYTFVLLTPDECAYTASQRPLPDEARVTELRARPNVIFEFGYLVGRLGRKRVCCLY
jgi:predicted nucleotide-binding protein